MLRLIRFPTLFLIVLLSTTATAQTQDCPTPSGEAPFVSLDNTENGETISIADLSPRLLDYLNNGGAADDLQTALDTASADTQWSWRNRVLIQDVTGDDAAEVLVQLAATGGDREDSFIEGTIFAFVCQDGRYQAYTVARLGGYLGGGFAGRESGLRTIEDMNANGVPEFVVAYIGNFAVHGYFNRDFIIFEWDGSQFIRLIPPIEGPGLSFSQATTFEGDAEIYDTDGDGTLELVLTGAAFRHHNMYEWSRLDRADEEVWAWNGTVYESVCYHAATPPIYRIQAIQDGGDLTLCGRYDEAVASYQQAITDESLLPWSEADNACPGCPPEEGSLPVVEDAVREMGTPVPDPDEPLRLSAYAHYRIILLYVAQSQLTEAQAEYDLLQTEFAATHIGHEYAELATAFWDAYNEDEAMTDACLAVKVYAANQEIDSPISSYNFYGAGLDYPTEDLCPF